MVKKPRCPAQLKGEDKECRAIANPMTGFCGLCERLFCTKHRLLEEHDCPKLKERQDELHAENAAQLEKERTQVVRI